MKSAPLALKIPQSLEIHGDVRVDDYYWLRDRSDPAVLAYLEKENAYYESLSSHSKDFQTKLYLEMKARIREDDSTVPYKYNGYWYFTKYQEGREYPVYLRKNENLDAAEEVMFNCNEMAEGHDYFHLSGISISPDNTMASFGVDITGRRQYEIRIKNLLTGEFYGEIIENTTGGAVWANDNKTLYYTSNDEHTLRSDKIFRHQLDDQTKNDVLVFHEEDDAYYTFVYKSKSRKYIVMGSTSTLTSEFRILSADDPHGTFRIFAPRERGVEYSIAHYGSHFYVLTNKDQAVNFKMMRVGEEKTTSDEWQDFIPHRPDVLLEDIEIFKEYYVLSERDNGLNRIKIVRWEDGSSYYLPFDNETYIAYGYVNPDFNTETFRYIYNAMTSPYAVIDFNMRTKEKAVKKEQEVLGGKFHAENYKSERLWATARDGVRVPISLVYHKDTPLDGSSPLLQNGYGAYGNTSDPYFSSVRLSLLDRGFIYAIAHIRGGEYLGRPWYENGKLLHKKNTFTDFIDCSQFLIDRSYTSPDHLYAYGGSAGGLLIGAVINMAPELYHGVIAAVPFVDLVTTMLDESIPLTTGEYDEWGNPNDREYYDYMKSYSPYDNVKEQDYPHILVTTGLHDSQVQYWEPAKWVAKLRRTKTDNHLLFLHTNMEAGHGGASGRFEALKETAREYSFLLDLEGKIQ